MKNDRIVRIIPRLDIKGRHLVKGIHLEGLRVLGFPEDYSRYYGENSADELIFQDVVASLFERNSLQTVISKVAKETFIPLTVGGGLRTLEDIRKVLNAGADRVCINTQAIKDPNFIKLAAQEFGRSTIVVAIETIKQNDGKYLCFTDNGRQHTGVEALDWARRIEELGAGEILLTSVDFEGRGDGFDIEFVKKFTAVLATPVIAHGGAGSIEHVVKLFKETEISGVALASLFHYHFVKDYKVDFSKEKEGNFEFLKNGDRTFKKIQPATILDLKKRLIAEGISVRI